MASDQKRSAWPSVPLPSDTSRGAPPAPASRLTERRSASVSSSSGILSRASSARASSALASISRTGPVNRNPSTMCAP